MEVILHLWRVVFYLFTLHLGRTHDKIRVLSMWNKHLQIKKNFFSPKKKGKTLMTKSDHIQWIASSTWNQTMYKMLTQTHPSAHWRQHLSWVTHPCVTAKSHLSKLYTGYLALVKAEILSPFPAFFQGSKSKFKDRPHVQRTSISGFFYTVQKKQMLKFTLYTSKQKDTGNYSISSLQNRIKLSH